MLWPCSVKCMLHSPSGLPIDLCCSFFFPYPFFFWIRWICFLPCHLSLNNHLTPPSPYWAPLLLSRLPYRPSTKTIWSWRKETSTSTHSSPGRPTPTHTSPISTPTMTINPPQRAVPTAEGGGGHQGSPIIHFDLSSFLCASYWDSWHHAWASPTRRLYYGSC